MKLKATLQFRYDAGGWNSLSAVVRSVKGRTGGAVVCAGGRERVADAAATGGGWWCLGATPPSQRLGMRIT